MILYPGGPPVWGQWYWCPPGADFIDVPHVFASSNDDSREVWGKPFPIGEQRGTVQWVKPRARNTRVVGKGWCGSVEAIQGKATAADVGTPQTDADGVPLCCNPPDWPGGSAVGGESDDWGRHAWAGCVDVSLTLELEFVQINASPPFPPGFGTLKIPVHYIGFGFYYGILTRGPGAVYHATVAPFGLGFVQFGFGESLTFPGGAARPLTCGPLNVGPIAHPVSGPHFTGFIQRLRDIGPPVTLMATPATAVDWELQQQAESIRSRLLDDGTGNPCKLGLTRQDYLQQHGLTLAMLNEADYSGYARVSLPGPWDLTHDGQGTWRLEHPPVLFQHNGGAVSNTVYQTLILSESGGGNLRYLRRVAGGPVQMAAGSLPLSVVPVVTVRSQYLESNS